MFNRIVLEIIRHHFLVIPVTSFALVRSFLSSLMCPPEESPTAEAADAAVVRVMNFSRWRFITADGTDPLIINFRYVGVQNLRELN